MARSISRFLHLVLLFAGALSAQDFSDLSARAAAARTAGDSKSAIILYRQALQLKPDWAEGWWLSGSLAYDSENYGQAVEALQHLVQLRPKAGLAWALLGLCEYETHAYSPALDHVRQAMALGVGDQPQMRLVLQFHEASLLTKQGHFEAALRQYASFLPAKVSDENVLLGLGLAQLRQPMIPAEVAPERRDLLLSAGRALAAFLTHDDVAVHAAYSELVQRFPNEPEAHYAFGYFLFASDPQGAIAQWESALAADSGYAPAHAMLSWAFFLRDQQDKALVHAETAVSKDAGLTVAQIVLGRLLADRGRIADGLAHLTQAALLEPENLEAHLGLATAYSQAGRKADAQRERQICLRMQAGAK